MKNGYYLSIYAHIDELVHLKKINLRHDQNMALWLKSDENIELVHYWEFERVTGLKHHGLSFYNVSQTSQIINDLLKPFNISLDDIVEIWGTPRLQTDDDYTSLKDYPDFTYHSVMHLFSSIFMDSNVFYNSKIIALAVDGGPDNVVDPEARKKDYYVGAFCDKGRIKLFSIPSPGLLWMFMKIRYKMEEGSLMALGSASNSEAFIKVGDIYAIKNTEDIFGASKWFNDLAMKIESLSEEDTGKLFSGFDDRFSEKDNKISMVVKIIKKISFEIMEQIINNIVAENNVDPTETYIALSGGYCLNCPSNSYLMQKYKFKGFLAPPCVNDAGLALGIGLYAFNKKMDKINFVFKNAFYGDSDPDTENIINSGRYSQFISSASKLDYSQIVNDLKNQPIMWFNGRAEIGPRALGNRSLLAEPRSFYAKDELNRIKMRQWWRPVAPIILEEAIDEWFIDGYPSPYMLHTFKIREDKKALVPAILHLDDTARVQTLKYEDNPDLYMVIKEFYKDTGIPIICNTSLNDRGEPIINKTEEALNFALRKEIKVVYINKWRLELTNFANYTVKGPFGRQEIFSNYIMQDDVANKEKQFNPSGLIDSQLVFYYNTPELHQYNLSNEKDVKSLVRIMDLIRKNYKDKFNFNAVEDAGPVWDTIFKF